MRPHDCPETAPCSSPFQGALLFVLVFLFICCYSGILLFSYLLLYRFHFLFHMLQKTSNADFRIAVPGLISFAYLSLECK